MDYVPPCVLSRNKEEAEVTKAPTELKNVVEDGITIITNSPYGELEDLKSIPCAKLLSFTKPTPIQRHTIPVLQSKHSMMARAPTGMGKTLCFLLPMIDAIRYSGMGINVLIISPTRELAVQIKAEAEVLCKTKRLKVVAVYGSMKEHVNYNNIDVLVATPGRLLDCIERGKLKVGNVQNFVLDEADKLLEMGFENAIRSIKGHVNKNARVALFSATYHSNLERIINDFLPSDRCVIEVQNETVSSIRQTVLSVENKDEKLCEILGKYNLKGGWKACGDTDKIIIFVERKVMAAKLENKLRAAGFNCNSLHGDKEQRERLRILDQFKRGILPLLVATSVAARGIDAKDVKMVINYDFPKDIKEYIHKIGRTGREGKTGEAVSFIDSSITQGLVTELIAVLKESGNEVPECLTKRGTGRGVSSGTDRAQGGRRTQNSEQRRPRQGEESAMVGVMAESLSEMGICKNTLAEKSDSDDDLPGEW
ncbi:hypothetical protein PAEPH01_1134 [Pancytospora epiphaga]|nr:hypothetical protein PAEPH01_1134 [Pancytospora epiphaga]